jgi:hypothetical protein
VRRHQDCYTLPNLSVVYKLYESKEENQQWCLYPIHVCKMSELRYHKTPECGFARGGMDGRISYAIQIAWD